MAENVKQQLVLIVDDEELNRKMMTVLLGQAGHAVITAGNGQEALASARAHLPDLIMLDIMMPVMDGFTACKALRADPATAHIPIVMITAMADKETKLKGLAGGANDFLTKPVDHTELGIKTANLLKIKRYEDTLRRQNDILEETIRNRTRELTNAVADLRKEIAERRAADDRIVRSEAKLRAFIDSTQDMVYWTDEQGRFLLVNQAGAEMFGHKRPEEMTGRLASDYWQRPEDRRVFVEKIRRDKVVRSYPMPAKKTDGSTIELEASSRVIEGTDGSFGGLEGIIRDVTERNRAERELQARQEELVRKHDELNVLLGKITMAKQEWERSIDAIEDMIVMVDSRGMIKRCNRSLQQFMGEAYSAILGCPWDAVLRLRAGDTTVTMDSAAGQNFEARGRRFQMHSFPFTDIDDSEGRIFTIRDVTELNAMTTALEIKHRELEQAYNELKIAQSQITQQEKMASIGQLAAGVAHEINNPTGFITSNLGSLRKYADKLADFIAIQTAALEGLPAESREAIARERKALKIDHVIEDLRSMVRESLDGADRIKRIVQDLKNFSRVDEAEMKLADINTGIESTINIVWNELKYKATVTKEYGVLPQIQCNPGQLNQVFMNLLVNAAHAIEKQGEIRIRTWAGNGTINVSVSDTGCGIPNDKINRIFEPFFTTKEVGKGTGLGLSIAYDIIKKHKGTIEVESEVGKGTSFLITIPVVRDHEARKEHVTTDQH